LNKEQNFQLIISEYLEFLNNHKPDTIVIINPNNPNGSYLTKGDISLILDNTKFVKNVIIDESFIHFAYEDSELSQISSEELIHKYENVIIIKSMSKDFGIAGLRAGYAVMSEVRVAHLLKNGFLWNVSGLTNYFFKVYSNKEFLAKYDIARKKYIMNTTKFLSELSLISSIKVYPSKANFALVEISNGLTSFDFFSELLVNNGIYVRDCSDKLGLQGEFVRIASRTLEENNKIVNAIKNR
jgi:histidinol-phosphate/aromatic aminotransferase/cobyric acid decarboxylase-like protein